MPRHALKPAISDATIALFELENVSFAVSDSALVQSLAMKVPTGRFVGLIGHKGSGKSAFLKLLARHQPASGGSIRFEGKNLSEWTDRQYARKVAYLPQQIPVTAGMRDRELVRLGRYPWHGALGRFS